MTLPAFLRLRLRAPAACVAALLFLSALLGGPLRAAGQDSARVPRRSAPVYVHFGYGPLLQFKKSFTLFLGLTVRAPSKPFGVSFQTRYGSLHAVNLPADYAPGLTVFGGDGIPRDEFFTAGLTGVWLVHPFSKAPSLRLRLEAGPSYVSCAKTVFAPAPASSSWFSLGSNYVASRDPQAAVGVEGAVRVEGLDRRFGVSGGLWGHASGAFRAVGIDFAVLLGRCR